MSPFRAQPSYAAGIRRIAGQMLSLPGITPVGTLAGSGARLPDLFGPTRPALRAVDTGRRLRHHDPQRDDCPSDRSALTAPTGAASRQHP